MKRGLPRKLPDDRELARRFATTSVRVLADEYDCAESTLYYHRRRITKAGVCWVCDKPTVGHNPSDHGDAA